MRPQGPQDSSGARPRYEHATCRPSNTHLSFDYVPKEILLENANDRPADEAKETFPSAQQLKNKASVADYALRAIHSPSATCRLSSVKSTFTLVISSLQTSHELRGGRAVRHPRQETKSQRALMAVNRWWGTCSWYHELRKAEAND